MTRHGILIAAALSAALATAGFAQESTTPPTPPAEAAPAAPSKIDEAFPVAEEEKPREILKAEFDDWQVRCNPADQEQCFMYQLAKDAEGRVVAEFTLIKLPEGGQATAGATIVTGLGVLLPRGVSLTIDSGKPLGYPYLYCAPAGCFARIGLTSATVTRMKKGAAAKLAVVPVNQPDKPIEAVLSLKGFTAAYDSLKPVKQP
ncbi:MAG: invasion associated locus B family protein [Alphaproteobacteria bacterium]|nr:MAG: invasion associated locus B family protein [Alphaproteobacteria bacterium]